jgi:hypothetical protein
LCDTIYEGWAVPAIARERIDEFRGDLRNRANEAIALLDETTAPPPLGRTWAHRRDRPVTVLLGRSTA